MNVYDIAAALPTIDVLRERCTSLAVLERIIDSSQPYYFFTHAWGDDDAALMNNGSGDEWAVVFTSDGVFIRVFDHESDMSPYRDPDRELWPGLLDGLPEVFGPHVAEPAFGDETGQFIATAVLWRLADDDRWHAGEGIVFPPDDSVDGAGMLAILLDDIVDRYVEFAEDYYEIEVDPAAVGQVVAHRPLTDTLVRSLNPTTTLADLHDDVAAIGYPMTAT
ncbi:hypothetical protein ACFQO7_06400 [Catellatospora aurea]|uniref:Immunity protein 35 of polymorphic toxin system n=1 Tax=Catellatospora aurea TaxID=1337874 RepID=A0ABW2GT53_9ACTN